MSFAYEAKSTIGSILASIRFIRKLFSYSPKVIFKLLKHIDSVLTFLEALLFTLFLRFIFNIPLLDIKKSFIELLSNFSFANPFIIFVIQIAIIQFLKSSINSRIRYKYAFYNSEKLNLEYVSDSIDEELKYHINENYKNPLVINILCISGEDTFVSDKAYLHEYIENLESNNLEINIIVSNCLDSSTLVNLESRSKLLNSTETNYYNQISKSLEYSKELISKGIKVNFFLSDGIPEFKIVIIDRIAIIQNYASSINSNKKTVFVISKSNTNKDENNSIFEAYYLYFRNKKDKARRIHIRETTILKDLI